MSVGIIALAACGTTSTAPSAAESSYYAESPSASPASLIPKKICRDVQNILDSVQTNINEIAANAKGQTEQFIELLSQDLSAASVVLSGVDPTLSGTLNEYAGSIDGAGTNIGNVVEGLTPKIDAMKASVLEKCPV